jgi:predicted 3-demethylubiquinone-9 3-methyltransferase (glyoxalase superfamily)
MSATFELLAQQFIALNGGPRFTFSPAIPFFVSCKTQAEVDELWEKLVAGGEPQRCGWLGDKYGLSWQIIPTAPGEMLQDEDAEKSNRVHEGDVGHGRARHRRPGARLRAAIIARRPLEIMGEDE